jgi:1,4-dihydroxy-2-naphthoyl-CoA synthase
MSLDPALNQTQQPYGYANENPVSNSDPSGRFFVRVIRGAYGWYQVYVHMRIRTLNLAPWVCAYACSLIARTLCWAVGGGDYWLGVLCALVIGSILTTMAVVTG